MNLASYFDHTNLSPNATKEDIRKLCTEAKSYGFFSVCVHPYYVELAKEELLGSEVKVATVVGFPLGQNTKEVKAFEADQAVSRGADEIDMVINYAALKDGDENEAFEDMLAVKNACGQALLKVIIETSELSEEQMKKACLLARRAGADFVKTSTGFSSAGAKREDVALMAEVFEGDVKASGGIRDLKAAREMIDAGATRIGASAGVSIVEEERR